SAREAGKARQPAQRPTCAGQRRVQAVVRGRPDGRTDDDGQQQQAADVPETRGPVLFMYFAADGLRLALIDKAEFAPRFREILARVDAHERAGRTVQLARIDVCGCALRVQRRVAAQVALDRDETLIVAPRVLEFQFGRGRWRTDAQSPRPTPQSRGEGQLGRLFARLLHLLFMFGLRRRAWDECDG